MPPRDLIGQAAPPLDLLDSNGQPYHLRPGDNSLPIALFFYPKAGTYGCTREACQFRDLVLGKRLTSLFVSGCKSKGPPFPPLVQGRLS